MKPLRLAIIGLGVMGREMFRSVERHPDFTLVAAVDADVRVIEQLAQLHPEVMFGTDPSSVIGVKSVDAVYIATPPSTHAELVVPALESGQAVFCEKPLAVSLADAKVMCEVAQRATTVAAVNFSLSDRAATRYLAGVLENGEVGDILAVDINLAFPAWPRTFQTAAGWVGGRSQGGFVREVFSHFAYLTDRLVGRLEPVDVGVAYRDSGSEATASGMMTAGLAPVRFAGVVGARPEQYEWILTGSRRSFRFTNWRELHASSGGDWELVDLPGEQGSEASRLALFAQAMRGTPSADLADFDIAYRVQRAVEAFHEETR
ncbi:Gfo/Idh/MocA family protein [Kribbella sp. CA-293567]|uniref:Gfo/Idh/MocA family protein n=1 Tax=Kribbella sp. CA-293567 TaxID=3002436 RepID=UPI0022DD7FBD|nr:Gfo/Idh/MocA family oxidoreductase [Kribbella sp. CA-293567]WBQ04360.1 Gfo/Idh/MocA family oxidoreductase [Kribbella sp. CA-293567]